MGFKLIRLDAAEPSKITLQVGSRIIGRDDSFLNCEDPRVSRNHAMIKVTNDTVILESLHQNPCFYNKLNSQNALVLDKGQVVSLSNTDHFGLLPDSYWYELIFCEDPPHIDNKSNTIGPEMKINDTEKQGVNDTDLKNINPPVASEVKTATISYHLNNSYKLDGDNNSDTEPLNLGFGVMEGAVTQLIITSYNPVPVSVNTPPQNNQTIEGTSCDDQTICSKRPHTPEPSADAKKVKKEPESPETDNPVPNITEPHSTGEAQQVELSNPVNASTDNIVNPEQQNLNHVNTPSHTSTDVNIPIEFCANAINTIDILMSIYLPPENPVEAEEPQCSRDVVTGSENAYAVVTDPPSSGNEDVVKELQSHDNAEVKNEPQSPEDKKSILENPEAVVPGPSQQAYQLMNVGCPNDDGIGAGVGVANAAPALQPDRPRERCLYGAGCYRKNPHHKLQFSHPSDADYGPYVTGQCPYGASCRRVDPRHWLIHHHPPGTEPPLPQPQGNPVKKRERKVVRQPSESEESNQDSPSDLILEGKRKRKTVKIERRSDSEEEAQDPYGTDESDDWKP